MTQDQFWNILKEVVMFHPPNTTRPCLQLQTWALLKNFEANLNDQALGMTMRDKGKPTFFSRRWAESGFNPNSLKCDGPYLVANVIEMQSEWLNSRERVDTVIFDLAVLDAIEDPKARPTPCNGRNENEMFRDAWALLNHVFSAMRAVVQATVTPLVGPDYTAITFPAYLDALVTANAITAYVADPTATRSLQRDFQKMTKTMKGLPWRGGLSNLHGMYVTDLTIRFHECPETAEFTFPEYAREVSEQEPVN